MTLLKIMMAKRSKRLSPVARFAGTREQQAAVHMAESQRKLDAHNARLLELVQYRDEYAKAFQQAGSNGLEAIPMRDFQVFLEKLGNVISSQRSLVSQAQEEHAKTKTQWLKLRGKAQALDKVVSRYQLEERRQDASREQNEADEHAQTRR
ncbi:MAG TPA: flagellar export protein FliJ [Acidiferrobacteraceae bacterium]|nr:flagellar export protein FliJ [Acidiferrobacteraceae bacterium]